MLLKCRFVSFLFLFFTLSLSLHALLKSDTGTISGTVAAHPEALDIDRHGERVFANLADAAQVAVVNIRTNATTGLLVSSHNLLYVGIPSSGSKPAEIRAYRTNLTVTR